MTEPEKTPPTLFGRPIVEVDGLETHHITFESHKTVFRVHFVPVRARRSWRERLWSWPWQPWVGDTVIFELREGPPPAASCSGDSNPFQPLEPWRRSSDAP